MRKHTMLFCLLLYIFSAKTLFAQSAKPIFIPDSVISLCSIQEVTFEDRVFGLPLWPMALPDSAIQHQKEMEIFQRNRDLNELGLNRAARHISQPFMMVFPIASGNPRPLVLIFPGGVFRRVVFDREGFDVAHRLNLAGIAVAVVFYRTVPEKYWPGGLTGFPESVANAMQRDAQKAVQLMRERSGEFNVAPERIGVMGFSAGGALAANLVTRHKMAALNFGSLNYAVIPDSTILNIDSSTTPTFLLSTEDDDSVPAAQLQTFHERLLANQVKSRFYLFKSGGHGYGLGIGKGQVADWPNLFVNWLKRLDVL